MNRGLKERQEGGTSLMKHCCRLMFPTDDGILEYKVHAIRDKIISGCDNLCGAIWMV